MNNGLMSMFTGGGPFTGDWPQQQPQAQSQPQQPSLMGNNASVMQLLQSMMSQPGGNPFGAPTMGDLPSFGTPWAGGMPQGLPDIGPRPSAQGNSGMGGKAFSKGVSLKPHIPKSNHQFSEK